tara:strand:+ start:934 stop:1152 length:219 start_codon:yes stop_codon:yes gene_type:complete
MTTREEATKMRKELIRAERILAQKEKAKPERADFTPMMMKEKDRPEPKTADVPNVIHLPKRKKSKKENVPFF